MEGNRKNILGDLRKQLVGVSALFYVSNSMFFDLPTLAA